MTKEHHKITRARKKAQRDSFKHKNAERFNPSFKKGLNFDEVGQRQEEGLVNEKPINRSKSYKRIVFENVFNFCNTIIIIIIGILIAVGAWSYTVSSCIIFINMIIGIVQEIKAKWTVEKLALVVDSHCEVIRDSKTMNISTKNLVLDDIYKVDTGMQIPVDSIIKDGYIEIDESILTGESFPVRKGPNETILAGSHIVGGKATVQADKVGKDCYIENIAKVARRVVKPNSNIFKVLDRIIKVTTLILLPLSILLLISNMMAGTENLDTTIIVSSSILGMLPVGMFLLTSTALAASVLRLSKKNTLAQDLYSIEMLAMVDTLLLDKTGTITDGNLKVVEEKDLVENDVEVGDILMTLIKETQDNSPTAKSMSKYFSNTSKLEVKNILPFSSIRKYSAISLKNGKSYAFGAPDFMTNINADLKIIIDNNSQNCKRTLMFVEILKGDITEIKSCKIRPLKLFALEDNLRTDVEDSLKWFSNNEVEIKVVSGDDPYTVSRIANKTGVANAEKYVNCADLNNKELSNMVENKTVFGRVAPEQKSTIVKLLQNKGRVVGMVGDGVNDVQALKQSDCSISFAQANEVARNISRIILLDSNFKTLPSVVSEGRRVISNVEKVSTLYVMKNIFVMFMTMLFTFLTFFNQSLIYPYNLKKMLLIEFFVIGVPTFVFALQPNNKKVEGDFLRNILKSCIPAGIALIIGASLPLIIGNLLHYDVEYIASFSSVALALTGFTALFIIALPLNKIRLSVSFGMLLLAFIAVIVDRNYLNGTFLGLVDIQTIDYLWIALSVGVATIFNLATSIVVNYVSNLIRKKEKPKKLTKKQLKNLAIIEEEA